MAFFTEQWIICNMSEKDVLLARKNKKSILLNKIVGDSSGKKEEILADDVSVEYDIDLSFENKIYLLYQNQEGHLILKVKEDSKIEEIKLTPVPIGEVVHLNIKVINKKIHILYISKISKKDYKYNVHHHYYNGSSWEDFIVEEIIAKKVLNPIKVITIDGNILVSYYRQDNEIVLREFNSKEIKWEEEIVISNSEEEKLFLDMIKVNETIHLTYCEYTKGKLVVMYKGLTYKGNEYLQLSGEVISNEGSPAYPNLIFFKNKLWITWVELNKIISRFSEDMGQTWDSLFQWDDSRNMDFIRYKYLALESDEGTVLDHSFGSISPNVKLMGFGPTRNTTEVFLKTKQFTNLPRI